MKNFTELAFTHALYESLVLVNREIEGGYMAAEAMRGLRNYVEERVDRHRDIDVLELYDLNSVRTKAVYEALWEILGLEFTYYN